MEEPSPLLRLTTPIRRRIYSFIGIVPWDRVKLPHKFDLYGRKTPAREQPEASAFHGLLLSCRVVYSEAAPLLYSANRFILHYAHAGPGFPEPSDPLRPLRALTPTALASLTNLTIVLNQASCHHDFSHGGYYSLCCLGRDETGLGPGFLCKGEFHSNAHNLPLLATSPTNLEGNDNGKASDAQFAAAQQLLAKWHSAATHLSFITSGQLDLALVCDIDPHHERALEVAASVIIPLRRIPQLKACHIRLCKIPDPGLQRASQDAVSEVLRIAPAPYARPSTSQTSLVTLPPELRLRILEYTDLIVPTREVTWSRQERGYVVFYRDSDHSPDREHRDRFSPCLSSSCDRTSIGCFCRRRHAAFSFTCDCWAPPGPRLFLICRTLYRDAQFTFFSGNHFIIHDYWADPCWALPFIDIYEEPASPTLPYDYPSERFGASQFLREVIPTHCLAYLRFLELVFPSYLPQSWPQAGQPAMQDWWATVGWLEDKIQAPALTIRLVVADKAPCAPYMDFNAITPSEMDTIMRSFQELLRSLKPLADRGLARFYTTFRSPWRYVGKPQNGRVRLRWCQEQDRALKERSERFVMGNRYGELYANGRKEPRESFWTWTHYAQC
ncbi:uncharacterized protein B0H64DRAFT_405252 [Chaetomium fimeti]|uniref:F-box domain-containing protein n=1 Tax=Chaetomium fimeti TaxID=1854472 RepID=A0AAE0HBU0_9PEZI|nr:hypothetical protein B0H64DRAFT_405252 [Chaetomium fimeti]